MTIHTPSDNRMNRLQFFIYFCIIFAISGGTIFFLNYSDAHASLGIELITLVIFVITVLILSYFVRKRLYDAFGNSYYSTLFDKIVTTIICLLIVSRWLGKAFQDYAYIFKNVRFGLVGILFCITLVLILVALFAPTKKSEENL